MAANPSEVKKEFKEYPALEASVQDGNGTWYNLRAYADKEGHLKGRLEINPSQGERQKIDVEFKETARGFGATFSTADGQKKYVGISAQDHESKGKTYKHAVMMVSDMIQKEGQNRYEFHAVSERPGRVRMNEALASLENSREAKMLEGKLSVSRRDLEPYRGPEQAKAEPARDKEAPAKASPAKEAPVQSTPAPYEIKQEKTIGDREAGADHGVWSGKVVGIDSAKNTVDMESKIGGENGVTRVHLQGKVPENLEVGKIMKVSFDKEKGIVAGPVERKAPAKGMER